jgi:hypothetical protein
MNAPRGFDAERLYALLPAIHRIRDAEQAGGALRDLLAVLAEQIGAVEESLEQLYDDQFIETCAEWVVPYVGDLVGSRALHGAVPGMPSARAEVAHTIAFRRRKGTASMLEQLARDVTGWNARAVEFFQRLGTTQYMNHLRPDHHQAPDLRRWERLARAGTAFDELAHTADVRRIASGRGRHNIPNVGLFLWRVDAHRLTRSPAVRVDDRRWRASPLGHDMPLYRRPETEDEITHLAEPANVPEPLARRVLASRLAALYGASRSLALHVDGAEVPVGRVRVCDLRDDGATWAHLPADDVVAVDPELGRVALPATATAATTVEVTFHHGFPSELGGGEYERAATFASPPDAPVLRVPDDHPTIQGALDALGGAGVVEITDGGRYEEAPQLQVREAGRIELRAANGRRPTLALTGEMTIAGEADAEVALNGLLVTGNRLRVPATAANELARLRLSHLTLVPGWTLTPDGAPGSPDEPSLVAEIADLEIAMDHAVTGGVRAVEASRVRIADSVVDATRRDGVAYAAPDGESAGGELSLDAVTVIGKVHAMVLRLVSDSILLAALAPADAWSAPVVADRRQEGCVRFTWLPAASRVPRRFRCQPPEDPAAGARVAPRFTTLRYGRPAYAQLAASTPAAIRRGASDESEMGAWHGVHAPQREANLRIRLDEYLRAGLEAGIFHES